MAKKRNPSWLGGAKKEVFPRCAKLGTATNENFRAILTHGLKTLNHPEILIRLSAGNYDELWESIKLLIVKITSERESLKKKSELTVEELSKTFQIVPGKYFLDKTQQDFLELTPIESA